MPRRLDKTLTDYLVIAISPALIMAMIGSLVFFLLEVLYQGNYAGRLNVIMALFVMAIVLIGRISIEEGAERAALFALPLVIAVALAMSSGFGNNSGKKAWWRPDASQQPPQLALTACVERRTRRCWPTVAVACRLDHGNRSTGISA